MPYFPSVSSLAIPCHFQLVVNNSQAFPLRKEKKLTEDVKFPARAETDFWFLLNCLKYDRTDNFQFDYVSQPKFGLVHIFLKKMQNPEIVFVHIPFNSKKEQNRANCNYIFPVPFGTERNSVWFQINLNIVNTI